MIVGGSALKRLMQRGHFRSVISKRFLTKSVLASLKAIVGNNNLGESDAIREQHGRDESYHKTLKPDIVVFPSSVDEVSAVLRLCNEARVPVIPFGTGTGMEGGVVPTMGGVTIDLTRIDQIVAYHPEDFDVQVEPGVTRKQLNHFVKDDGLWFPVDPGADASICGMCATSASGTNAVRYGTMRENVLNLEVVLADGTVINTAGRNRRAKKTSAGYNLTNLFVGSEGTLGVITKATIRLYGIPEAMVSAVCHFPDVASAVNTTVQTLQCGIPVARIEFLDDQMMMAVNRYAKTSYQESPSLFLEFHGSRAHVEAQAKQVGELCEANGGGGFQWASTQEERNQLWKARHNALYAAIAMRPGQGCRGLSTDVAVPISQLTDAIQATAEDVRANWKHPYSFVGHVGDGNYHCTMTVDPHSPVEMALVAELAKRITLRALELDGTCTGEHGVGLGKREYLVPELGAEAVRVMKLIKNSLDPNGIMNPGKVLS